MLYDHLFIVSTVYFIVVLGYHFYLMRNLSYKSEIKKNKTVMLYHIFLCMFFPLILFLGFIFMYMIYAGFMFVIYSIFKFFN